MSKKNPQESKSEKRFGRNDIILLLILAIVFGIVFAAYSVTHQKAGAYVMVTVHGKEYGEYSLSEDRTVKIRQDGEVTNVLAIKDGYADMIKANCKNQICVHEKSISKTGETIACIPNSVVVKVEGGQSSNIDSIAR